MMEFLPLIISFVLTVASYLLAPKPKTGTSASYTDMDSPTAEGGRSIPVVFGTITLKSPNFLWYADKTRTTDKSGNAAYYLSAHLGFCIGPIDYLAQLYLDEKIVTSVSNMTGNASIAVNEPNLFGGTTEGGGVSGTVHVLFGGDTQTLPTDLASRMFGTTPSACPGYRGQFSLAFVGSGSGFLWRHNQASLPSIWAKVRRAPKGLSGDPLIGVDANPAHILYEALTDSHWGLGLPSTALDEASFLTAAQTLREEGLGLSLVWSAQEKVEAFADEILSHISGTLSVDNSTGLLTLGLLRADYNPAALFEINPDNAVLTSFSRKLWGETTNQIDVTYTDADSEEAATVTVFDPANIAIQGAVVASTRDYHGVRDPAIAYNLGMRDILAAGTPLIVIEADVNRQAWSVKAGDAVRLTWPEYGVADLVLRITAVDYGEPGSPAIHISAIQDVFALEDAGFIPPSSAWTPVDDPDAPDLNMAAPSSFTAAAITLVVDGSSVQRPALYCTWASPPEAATGIKFQYRPYGTPDILEFTSFNPENEEVAFANGVLPGLIYEVRARYVAPLEYTTAWTSWVSTGGVTDDHVVTTSASALSVVPGAVDEDALSPQLRFEVALASARETVEGSLAQILVDIRAEVQRIQELGILSDILMRSVSTTVDGHTASVTEILQSIAGVSAAWIVAVDIDGNVVGLVKLDGSAAESQFSVVADKFVVAQPGESGGAAIPVFTIANVDGVPKLALRGDMLADGTIAARMLTVAQLSALTADMGTITAGRMQSEDELMVIDLDNKIIQITV